MGLTSEIGRFLSEMTFSRVPDRVTPIVATGFTDCVAVLIAGLKEPVTQIVVRSLGANLDAVAVARFQGIPGIAMPDLALIYGTAAHALDYDDTGLSGHPSAVLVPTILAETTDTEATGEEMIAAYTAGYEVWAELIRRDSDQHHRKGWHPSGVFGTVAAASAVAVLRRLTADQASHAVGIAASMAGGLVANFGSMTKPFHVGRAAQSGVIAARLAQSGMTSASDLIEHKHGFLQAISPSGRVDTKADATLGREWRILTSGVNIKLYPMCYAAHRMIDAMIDTCHVNRLSADRIKAVDVELSDNQVAVLRNHRPQNALDAKFSAEFAVAAAAIVGRCGQAELTDQFVQRADVQDFFGKVCLHPTSDRDSEEPALAPFDRVKLSLRDGKVLLSEPVSYPRGHFKRGIDAETLWKKFSDCTADIIDMADRHQMFEKLQTLSNLSSIRELSESRVNSIDTS